MMKNHPYDLKIIFLSDLFVRGEIVSFEIWIPNWRRKIGIPLLCLNRMTVHFI